jgi:transposase
MMTVNSMTRDELLARAERIRARIAKTVEDIVDAGRELRAVKSSISRDQFIKWVEDEVGISQSTAYRWMSLTRRPSILRLRNLTPDLAYALTAKDATPEIIATIASKTEAGETVSVSAVKGMVAAIRHKRLQAKAEQRRRTWSQLHAREAAEVREAELRAKGAAEAKVLIKEIGVGIVRRVLKAAGDPYVRRALQEEIGRGSLGERLDPSRLRAPHR